MERLQAFLKQKDEDHASDMKKELGRARTEGEKEVVAELSHLWQSKEFAAEMMYGEEMQTFQ